MPWHEPNTHTDRQTDRQTDTQTWSHLVTAVSVHAAVDGAEASIRQGSACIALIGRAVVRRASLSVLLASLATPALVLALV